MTRWVSSSATASRAAFSRTRLGSRARAEGLRVRSSGGKLHVTDGPFTEAKEIIGGYALIEVQSKEDALGVARQFMELHRVHWPAFEGECEVRPLVNMERHEP